MAYTQDKNKRVLQVLLVLLLSIGATTGLLASPLTTIESAVEFPVIPEYEVYEDASGNVVLPELDNQGDWFKPEGKDASFGFSDSAHWLRFKIKSRLAVQENFVVEISYPLLDDVSFYARGPSGETRTLITGDGHPFHQRDIQHPNPSFRFQLEPGETTEILVRVSTKGSSILPLRVWREQAFFEAAAKEQKVHFFYYGALTVIILINLAVFFTLREKLYLFYALAILGYLLFFFTSRGFGHQLWLPNLPGLNTQLFLSSMPILALFSLLFAREFLKSQLHSPKLDLAIRSMVYFEYFNMIAAVVLDYNSAVKISAVSAFVLFGVLFMAGPITWASRHRAGVFFTIAWIPLTLGFVATAGRTSGFLPNNFLTEYAMQIGSGLEAFILTLALADRLYREREEKIQAQADSLQTEKQKNMAQSQLSEAMMSDPITGLPNRSRFEWLVNKTLCDKPDQIFVIGIARITRLGEITRTLGLESSERVLKNIATQMNVEASLISGVETSTNTKGKPEAAFQLSGDTVGVLISQQAYKNNSEAYHHILNKLLLPIALDELSIELGPRFGCAIYPAHGNTATQLIRNAHVAMENPSHLATEVGVYDESLDIYSQDRLTLMTELRGAIEDDSLELYYQPKLDLRNEAVSGVEALIRWQHPERGLVLPNDFIPLAEETGVINALTDWVFDRALRDIRQLDTLGFSGSVSINISARDLLNTTLPAHVKASLDKYQIDACRIYLELTETAAMEDPDAGLEALKKLESIGLKISIDDFGAGYSSLSYLKQLPATEIKLDRSLIADVHDNERSRVIVQSSIDMAHNLGYSLVAEGIEEERSYHLLKDMHCDALQGYWFCRPMDLDALKTFLRERREASSGETNS